MRCVWYRLETGPKRVRFCSAKDFRDLLRESKTRIDVTDLLHLSTNLYFEKNNRNYRNHIQAQFFTNYQ